MKHEVELTPQYRKDPDSEAFLTAINDALAPLQESLYVEIPEDYPTIQVVSVPRSGSTLLTQLIASGLKVGFINNLIASFWKAPVCGIILSEKLLSDRYSSEYTSNFGRTSSIHELHEFGYFWLDLLGYDDLREPRDVARRQIDWEHVRLVLNNLCHAFRKPVVFKNFLVSWHVREMVSALPRTCCVRVTRDPVETALSLLKMRETMFGSKESWASVKPKEYEWLCDEPYWIQVAGQVYYLDKMLDDQLAGIDTSNKVVCSLEKLRRSPNDVLQAIQEIVSAMGATLECRERINREFPANAVLATASDKKLVERAIAQFYGGT